jgi:hypothetical protein
MAKSEFDNFGSWKRTDILFELENAELEVDEE